jgi:hypothetical protein
MCVSLFLWCLVWVRQSPSPIQALLQQKVALFMGRKPKNPFTVFESKEIEEIPKNIDESKYRKVISSQEFNFVSLYIPQDKEIVFDADEFEQILKKYETVRRNIANGVIKIG